MTLSRFVNLAAAFVEITLSRLVAPNTRPELSRKSTPGIRTVAVFCYMGLGDAVMVLPMIRALKAAFPLARVECICSERTAAFHALTMAKVFDAMHIYEFKDASLLRRWGVNRFLRRQGYDLVICPYTAPIEHFVPFLLGVPHRAGHKLTVQNPRKPRPDWLMHYPAFIPPGETIHETERYRRILNAILPTTEMAVNKTTQRFYEVGQSPEKVSNIRGKGSSERHVIGVHAAVSPMLAWKNWGRDRFIALAKRCVEELNAEIVLFGDASERASLLAMAEEIHPDFTRVVTPLPDQNPHDSSTLEQTCRELLACELLVANESGVGHVAMSLGVPTVRIFGMTDFASFRALDTNTHTDIRKDLPCSPCFVLGKVKDGYNMNTCGHRNCLATISIDEVFEAVRGTLKDKLQ